MSIWPLVTLGDVCELVGGGTPSRQLPEYFGGEIPWITPTDVTKLTGRYLHKGRESITENGLAKSSAKLLPPNSVLLTSRATIGFTAINTVPVSTNQGFANFICGERIIPEYLAHMLEWMRDDLISRASGATFKEISKSTLKRISIPLPPLGEQRRIVSQLDRAADIRKRAEVARDKACATIPALFLDMFGDPVTNPMRWELTRLGDLANKMGDGPFGSNLKSEHYVEEGVRVWRLQNIGVGFLIDRDKAYISEDHFRSIKRHECNPGDVIIGTLGDPNLRAFIQPVEIDIAINKADCVQFRPDPSKSTAQYINWLMNMPGMLKLVSSQITGQTRARISMGRLREIAVPRPPLSLQEDFSEAAVNLSALYRGLSEMVVIATNTQTALSAEVFG